MKINTNKKNGFISIELVIVGCFLITSSIFMMNSFKNSNKVVAEESTNRINNSGNIGENIDNTIRKNYEEKKDEDKTEQEKNNATLIEPDTNNYAKLKDYQEKIEN